MAQWDSSLSVLPVARVQFPATAEYFKGFFPGWSLWSVVQATVLLEEDSGPTSAITNLENILHKGESATHEMDAIFKKKKNRISDFQETYSLSFHGPSQSASSFHGLTWSPVGVVFYRSSIHFPRNTVYRSADYFSLFPKWVWNDFWCLSCYQWTRKIWSSEKLQTIFLAKFGSYEVHG